MDTAKLDDAFHYVRADQPARWIAGGAALDNLSTRSISGAAIGKRFLSLRHAVKPIH